MSAISFGGLVSGLDTDTILTQLIALERRPINLLDAKQTTYENLLSTFQELNSKLASFQTEAEALNEAEPFQAVTLTSSDETILTATSSGSTNVGVYTIEVTKLAQAHKISTDDGAGFADSTSDLGFAGDLIVNGKTITIEAGDSLNNIRDKINDATDVGVSASVLQVADGDHRLLLTSEETGTDNSIVLGNTTVAQQLGLINGGGAIRKELQAAQDAEIKIGQTNPITVTRSSNTIDDVIEGVTLNLLDESELGTPMSLTINSDTDAVKQSIQGFIDAYNEVISYINEQTNYNSEDGTQGPLRGDFTARTVRSALQRIISSEVEGLSSSLTALSRIGITSSVSDGGLSIDDTKLTTALTDNPTDVKDLFEGLTSNLIDKLETFTDPYDGLIASRIEGTQGTIDNLEDRMGMLEIRVAQREEQLRAQFQAMESALAQLQSQSAFLAQQSTVYYYRRR